MCSRVYQNNMSFKNKLDPLYIVDFHSAWPNKLREGWVKICNSKQCFWYSLMCRAEIQCGIHGLCQESAGGREKAAMEERLEKMQQEVGNPIPGIQILFLILILESWSWNPDPGILILESWNLNPNPKHDPGIRLSSVTKNVDDVLCKNAFTWKYVKTLNAKTAGIVPE